MPGCVEPVQARAKSAASRNIPRSIKYRCRPGHALPLYVRLSWVVNPGYCAGATKGLSIATGTVLENMMAYGMLCNGVQLEGVKASLDLASGLFCYVSLHNIRDGI